MMSGQLEDPARDRPAGLQEDPARDRPAGLQENPVRDRPTGGTASKSPGTMHQLFQAHMLKPELFWDISSTGQPNFHDWLVWFENGLALQDALLPASQTLSPMVRCRSMVQHLGSEGQCRFATTFEDNVLPIFDADYNILHAVLVTIFAKSTSCSPAEDCFATPQLKTSSNATSVKPDFSVEDSPCLGSLSLVATDLSEKKCVIRCAN